MMTPEERQKAFAEAYNALIVQFGVGFKAVLKPEVLGDAVLIKPAIEAVVIDNWQPPKEDDNTPSGTK